MKKVEMIIDLALTLCESAKGCVARLDLFEVLQDGSRLNEGDFI